MKTRNMDPKIEHGLKLCRRGRWDEGVTCLKDILETRGADAEYPAAFYSYLGYGLARKENRIRDALKLCKKACEIEFLEPINFLNMARVQLLAGNRRAVVKNLNRGLRLNPNHAGLLKFKEMFGVRRSPVLPFLSRNSLVNRVFGVIRHRLAGGVKIG